MRLGLRLLGACAVFGTACNTIVGWDDFLPLEEADAGRADGGTDAAPSSNDGGDEDVLVDAAIPPRCNPLAPFGKPELAEGLNPVDGGTASSAILTRDELEVFFVHTDPSDVKTFRHGRRTDRTEPWTAAQIVTEPLAPPPASGLSIPSNGLTLYYRDSQGALNRVATRSALSEAFGSTVAYAWPGSLFVSASDKTVYGSFRPDGGDTVLGRAENRGTTATLIAAIPNVHATGATDERPIANASETRLYFMSTRQGQLTRLGDVYVATRSSTTAEFGASTRVEELSSNGADDMVTWVSDDDCEVLLDRLDGIYRAARPK